MVNQRLYYLDWAKFLGLYWMVWGHSGSLENYCCKWIYSFHMPLFFIISGMLSKNFPPPSGYGKERVVMSMKDNMIRLAKRLLLPYFLWCIVIMLIDICFYDMPLSVRILTMLSGTPMGHANALWFVYCIFMIKTINIFGFIRFYQWLILFVSLLYAFLSIFSDANILPRFIAFPLIAFPFYFIGFLLKDIIASLNKSKTIILTLVGMCFPFIAASFYTRFDLYQYQFGGYMIEYYAFGIMGSLFVILGCKLLLFKRSDIVVLFANGSIMILAIHRLLITWFAMNDSILYRIILSALILLLLYYPIKFCSKYVPILIGNRKK